ARTPTEELREMTHFAIRLAYPFLEQAKLLLQANSAKIEKEAYGTEVVILGSVPSVELDRLREELAELSSGQIRIEIESSESQRDAGEFGRST
ncbi:MAG TPA: DUF1949 domain-containing protein, partial [Sediminispirochaeta sp.]|nr:DUF1949 domain-containing protein [Sediminispirochaeta sp.]